MCRACSSNSFLHFPYFLPFKSTTRLHATGCLLRPPHRFLAGLEDLRPQVGETMMACMHAGRQGQPGSVHHVLNECLIDRGSSPSMVRLELYVDGHHITTVQVLIFITSPLCSPLSYLAGPACFIWLLPKQQHCEELMAPHWHGVDEFLLAALQQCSRFVCGVLRRRTGSSSPRRQAPPRTPCRPGAPWSALLTSLHSRQHTSQLGELMQLLPAVHACLVTVTSSWNGGVLGPT